MDENPYQPPQRSSAENEARSIKPSKKRRKRFLGGLTIAIGCGFLMLSAVVTRQIKKGEADRAEVYCIEYDRRNASVGLTLSGAALLSAGALMLLRKEDGQNVDRR